MTRSGYLFLAGLLALLLASALIIATSASSAGTKQFSDFPASETHSGRSARLDTKTAPQNWSAVRSIVKQIILEEIAKGPNFAGAYYLATVGCGTGCEAIFVIDLRNGRIYSAPESGSNGVLFQKDSRLIILKENKMYDMPRINLLFENGGFKKVE
jgi:hypothetical protein